MSDEEIKKEEDKSLGDKTEESEKEGETLDEAKSEEVPEKEGG